MTERNSRVLLRSCIPSHFATLACAVISKFHYFSLSVLSVLAREEGSEVIIQVQLPKGPYDMCLSH